MPLGLTHYMEVANITDVRQRADIANVMAVLSGFTTVAARKHRLRCEVAQALHQRLGRPVFPERLNPFGCGFAFGAPCQRRPGRPCAPGRRRYSRHERAVSCRAGIPAALRTGRVPAAARPRAQDLAASADYDLSPVRAIAEARAAREQELFELLQIDPADKRRLGDIAHARGTAPGSSARKWPENLLAPAWPIGRIFLLQGKGLAHVLSRPRSRPLPCGPASSCRRTRTAPGPGRGTTCTTSTRWKQPSPTAMSAATEKYACRGNEPQTGWQIAFLPK